ncbi:MAG: hypothetical protein NC390_03450 [Fusobacterium sp.]|nr:hypothetical protein [Fusobacterium sp.]
MVVNQVSNNLNMTSPAKFTEFKQPQNGYFIQPDQFAPENGEDKIDKKKLWMKIGLGVLLVGATSFGAVKAMPKSVVKKFDSFKEFLEKKIEKEATNSKTAIFYRTILKASLKMGEKFQGINNVISFKDIWFKRQITDRVPVLTKACDGITNWFTSIGRFTVNHSYKSTAKKFNQLGEALNNIDRELLVRDARKMVTINGETKTVEDWVKVLGVKRQGVRSSMDENFSLAKVRERYKDIDKIMTTLEEKVWGASFGDKNNFFKKDTYFTFAADKFLAVDKAHFGDGIHKMRSVISYNIDDQVKACRALLINNKRMLNPKDVVSEKLYREINKQLSALYGVDKKSPKFEKLQQELISKLNAFNTSVVTGAETYKYDDKIIIAVGEHTRIMKEMLASKKSGKLDEMLEIYEKLLPEKEFNKVKRQVKETVKSLDNSITKESVEYFDKRRDLKLGSAPTDILTILLGFGSLGIGLASTSDRDTQASVALKYGIPAIGGMLTSMVVTSMLVAGLKSHLVGFASSLVLNRAGVAVDDYRKKYNKEHNC